MIKKTDTIFPIKIITKRFDNDGSQRMEFIFTEGKFSAMRLFKTNKIHSRLFLFVTAIDQTVIARPNFEVQDTCWDDLPNCDQSSDSYAQYLIDTPVFGHLANLLEEEKYFFLLKNRSDGDALLEQLGNIQLPAIIWRELDWFKQFGYYYHHTLAISLLLTKVGMDKKLSKSFLQQALIAAITHDIGITRLPQMLLFSSHLFQEDDKIMMQQHPLVSYLLYGYYNGKKGNHIGQILLNHHTPERLETGPLGSLSEQIREITWMINNLDIFDSLISNRPFRPAYKIENALLYLKQVNQARGLPLDIVHWLEKQYSLYGLYEHDYRFIPIHPQIQSPQLN